MSGALPALQRRARSIPIDSGDTSPQKITYVTRYGNTRFFAFYAHLLTRPVPVKFQ
ncbi:hypothetical protein QCE63_14455 [Caballeronia sp. LZ065]|uniref:hypothetical protein n=1 Tax=Caballeronia sp. LZ065 TaxID=3038571 RepID=UPI00285F1893|nr:hypothetical protein [Caballeronia sp. LZ065]MDR5780621.1 hypothetical protein [Caballeronia sp. LZ065]